MNQEASKLHLQQQHTEESATLHSSEQLQQAREFSSVEEMIRSDRDQITVPPELGERLNRSLAQEPKMERPWWKKVFG